MSCNSQSGLPRFGCCIICDHHPITEADYEVLNAGSQIQHNVTPVTTQSFLNTAFNVNYYNPFLGNEPEWANGGYSVGTGIPGPLGFGLYEWSTDLIGTPHLSIQLAQDEHAILAIVRNNKHWADEPRNWLHTSFSKPDGVPQYADWPGISGTFYISCEDAGEFALVLFTKVVVGWGTKPPDEFLVVNLQRIGDSPAP